MGVLKGIVYAMPGAALVAAGVYITARCAMEGDIKGAGATAFSVVGGGSLLAVAGYAEGTDDSPPTFYEEKESPYSRNG